LIVIVAAVLNGSPSTGSFPERTIREPPPLATDRGEPVMTGGSD
jgi:hypothetical protein